MRSVVNGGVRQNEGESDGYLKLSVFEEFRLGYEKLHAALREHSESMIQALQNRMDDNNRRLHEDMRNADQNRRELLEKSNIQIQTGLQRAEGQLQDALEKVERSLQIALAAVEGRVNDKFESWRIADDKAGIVVSHAIEDLTHAQRAAAVDRTDFMTRNEFTSTHKGISEKIEAILAARTELLSRNEYVASMKGLSDKIESIISSRPDLMTRNEYAFAHKALEERVEEAKTQEREHDEEDNLRFAKVESRMAYLAGGGAALMVVAQILSHFWSNIAYSTIQAVH